MIAELSRQLHLIGYKAYTDLKGEAARGYLGLFWWVLEPLLYLGAFYVVFAVALKQNAPDFVPRLLIGLVTWKWFDASARMSATSITAGRGLMSQVYLPKMFFPAVVILRNSIKFAVALTLLLTLLLLLGYYPASSWAGLPLLIALEFALILGVGLMLAAIVPLWPDLKMVVENGLMLMFFLSGIFFDISQVGGLLGNLLHLNPMALLISAYRDCLLYGAWPGISAMAYVALLAIVFALPGWLLLRRLDQYYPRLL